jgi:hypothetical protein
LKARKEDAKTQMVSLDLILLNIQKGVISRIFQMESPIFTVATMLAMMIKHALHFGWSQILSVGSG